MKIADLIGDMALLFGGTPPAKQEADYEVMDVANGPDVQQAEPELTDQAESDVMIPPLQQKIELLKKAVDVDNFYDDESAGDKSAQSGTVNITLNVPPGQSNSKIDLKVNGQPSDDLDQIKKLAGVPVAAVFDAGDDEPLDS